MKPYADAAGRRTRQIVGDVLCVVWICWWVWTGVNLYVDTMDLTEPAEGVATASTDLGKNLRSTARNLGGVPLIGERAARPLRDAADNADKIALAGSESEESIEGLAFWGGISIALVPGMLAGAFYVLPRVRWARRAAANRTYLTTTGDLDLLALQGLASRSADRIAVVHPAPVRAWRTGDPAAIFALAVVELDHYGLTDLIPPTDERPDNPSRAAR